MSKSAKDYFMGYMNSAHKEKKISPSNFPEVLQALALYTLGEALNRHTEAIEDAVGKLTVNIGLLLMELRNERRKP